MKFLYIFSIFLILFSSCGVNGKVNKKNNMKKVESSSKSEHSYSSTSEVKEMITDPVTMDSCNRNSAINYEGHYFCSQESLNKYKEENN